MWHKTQILKTNNLPPEFLGERVTNPYERLRGRLENEGISRDITLDTIGNILVLAPTCKVFVTLDIE